MVQHLENSLYVIVLHLVVYVPFRLYIYVFSTYFLVYTLTSRPRHINVTFLKYTYAIFVTRQHYTGARAHTNQVCKYQDLVPGLCIRIGTRIYIRDITTRAYTERERERNTICICIYPLYPGNIRAHSFLVL